MTDEIGALMRAYSPPTFELCGVYGIAKAVCQPTAQASLPRFMMIMYSLFRLKLFSLFFKYFFSNLTSFAGMHSVMYVNPMI